MAISIFSPLWLRLRASMNDASAKTAPHCPTQIEEDESGRENCNPLEIGQDNKDACPSQATVLVYLGRGLLYGQFRSCDTIPAQALWHICT